MDVTTLIEPEILLPRLAEILDGLGHEGRVHTVATWTKQQKAAIFEAAKGHMPLDVDFLVPSGVAELVPVIHEGHNTLAVHNHFQKRFAKLPEGSVVGEGDERSPIAGYNHQALAVFSGPGYFVARKATGEHEGELAIDYTKQPKDKPASWPPIRDNGGLIPGIVYGDMIDYLRGISTHVSLGRAYKHGKPFDAWFALVREDPS